MASWAVVLNELIEVSQRPNISLSDLEQAFLAYCDLFSKDFFTQLKQYHQGNEHNLTLINFFEADTQAIKIEFLTLTERLKGRVIKKVIDKNMLRDIKKTLIASLLAQRDYLMPLIERV